MGYICHGEAACPGVVGHNLGGCLSNRGGMRPLGLSNLDGTRPRTVPVQSWRDSIQSKVARVMNTSSVPEMLERLRESMLPILRLPRHNKGNAMRFWRISGRFSENRLVFGFLVFYSGGWEMTFGASRGDGCPQGLVWDGSLAHFKFFFLYFGPAFILPSFFTVSPLVFF